MVLDPAFLYSGEDRRTRVIPLLLQSLKYISRSTAPAVYYFRYSVCICSVYLEKADGIE